MMLIQILTHQPQVLGTIVQRTPNWVWILLVALLMLGASQWVPRRASTLRVSIMPIVMAVFALYGLEAAFAGSSLWMATLALWLATAATCTWLALRLRPDVPRGTAYDGRTAHFTLPGSARPLAMIVGIFLIKYGVGVELALQPTQAHDLWFALGVAALYGVFNGLFTARLVRLWRLRRTHQPRASALPSL